MIDKKSANWKPYIKEARKLGDQYLSDLDAFEKQQENYNPHDYKVQVKLIRTEFSKNLKALQIKYGYEDCLDYLKKNQDNESK